MNSPSTSGSRRTRAIYQGDIAMGNKPLLLVFGLLWAALTASPASAQATRTWVSGVGDDANPCSRTAPCKTFAGAISKTAAGGEIDALDPGGFGSVTISKSITLDGGGFIAGVLFTGFEGITVNAQPSDTVTIRGMDMNGGNTGLNGVLIIQAGHVHIATSRIYGFTGNGI